ncbi:MAG: TRL-like family protein [Kiritimatiellia bacterium]|jgi:hypothetical protein|nr:TRL-like family protein [Kiritimatiellia bacterium]
MKKSLALSLLCAGALMTTGCLSPMKGNIMAVITVDHVASDPVVDNTVRPAKRGQAKSTGIICFATGDASIGAAMRNGGITKVHHVDYDVKNILFIYSEVNTIVYGE